MIVHRKFEVLCDPKPHFAAAIEAAFDTGVGVKRALLRAAEVRKVAQNSLRMLVVGVERDLIGALP